MNWMQLLNMVDSKINKVKALIQLAESSHSRNEAFNCYELADKIVIQYGLDAEMFESQKDKERIRQCN